MKTPARKTSKPCLYRLMEQKIAAELRKYEVPAGHMAEAISMVLARMSIKQVGMEDAVVFVVKWVNLAILPTAKGARPKKRNKK